MTLVIYDKVKLIFEELIVLAEVSILRYNYAFAFTLSVRQSGRSDAQVLRILNPVVDFLAACGNNKDTAFTLFDETLNDTKTGIGFTGTRTISKHIALAVAISSVIVALVEELELRFFYVLLLCGKEKGKRLANILNVAKDCGLALCCFLELAFLLNAHTHHSTQLLCFQQTCPLGNLADLPPILKGGVPHSSDKLVYEFISQFGLAMEYTVKVLVHCCTPLLELVVSQLNQVHTDFSGRAHHFDSVNAKHTKDRRHIKQRPFGLAHRIGEDVF